MKWISVKEEMPSDTVAVLVWCPERRNKYTAAWHDPSWVHFGGGFLDVKEEVTHWMPTPDSPPPPPTKEEIITESIISTVQKVGKFPQWGEDLSPFAKTLAHEIIEDLKAS